MQHIEERINKEKTKTRVMCTYLRHCGRTAYGPCVMGLVWASARHALSRGLPAPTPERASAPARCQPQATASAAACLLAAAPLQWPRRPPPAGSTAHHLSYIVHRAHLRRTRAWVRRPPKISCRVTTGEQHKKNPKGPTKIKIKVIRIKSNQNPGRQKKRWASIPIKFLSRIHL